MPFSGPLPPRRWAKNALQNVLEHISCGNAARGDLCADIGQPISLPRVSERRFRDDGTKATRFDKPNDGDGRMNENDEDVVHAGIVSKSQKNPGIQADFCNSPSPDSGATDDRECFRVWSQLAVWWT